MIQIKKELKDTVICLYGSHVYETANEQSDIDLIVISDFYTLEEVKDSLSSTKPIDIHLFNKKIFEEMTKAHEINALETIMLKADKVLQKNNWYDNFQLEVMINDFIEKDKLRHNISQKSSNSWVKGKKKFLVEKDFNPYIGKKSIWHAFRILEFGTQIAKYGQITDYKAENHRLESIMSCQSWQEIEENFKQEFNFKNSEFRQFAPKKIKI